MIKFFRKIRQKLLSENRFNKYLIYAIGEIILVVIGILIALQINNWNELRKLKVIELEILHGIKQDLISDTIDINYNLRGYKLAVKKDEILIKHLYNKKDLDNQFLTRFNRTVYEDWTIIFHRSTYDELKSKGLYLISNPELKTKINRLYQFDYPALQMEDQDDPYSNHRELMNSGWLDKYLKMDSTGLTMDSKSYNMLLNDSHAHYMIERGTQMKKYLISRYETILSKNVKLRSLIETEIHGFEN